MPTRPELFTLNFPRFTPDMGVPVRISNGFPKFVKYPLPLTIKELWPLWADVKADLDQATFRDRYREKLAGHGLDVIASRLRAMVAAGGDHRLVLMCYEDLAKPGWWCHRTMFAEWWTEQTGEPVTELGPTGPPPPPPREATLFD